MAHESELALVQENIDEYVNDENKIVTSKWLSLMLNLNINAAKKALYSFVEHHRKKTDSNEINLTYFVAGLSTSKSGDLEHKCVVVPESQLDAVKKSLSVVTSCHLYSVQAAKLKDYIPLYQTDYDVIKENLDHCSRFSSIKCSWVAQRTVQQPAQAVEKPASIVKVEKNESASTVSSSTGLTSSRAPAAAKKMEPKGSIASMFATTGQKKGTAAEVTVKGNQQKSGGDKNKVKPTDKKSGASSFFNNNTINKKTVPERKSPQEVMKTHVKKLIEQVKKTEESDDDEPDCKRRKRIRMDLFDSSGDDEKDDDIGIVEDIKQMPSQEDGESPSILSVGDDDENRENSITTNHKEEGNMKPLKDDIENEENPKHIMNGDGKKRKRAMKTVTKQYKDDEGFLVTKKEVVWESESDHSEPEEIITVEEKEEEKEDTSRLNSVPVKQNNKTSAVAKRKVEPKGRTTKKKLPSPQKGKQTSMTTFFHKR